MRIGVVAVKGKEKTYVGIHRLSSRYWAELWGHEVHAPLLSASPLRARLKKIRFVPGSGAGYVQQICPPEYLRSGGEYGQDEGARARASLAAQAAKTRDYSEGPAWAGYRWDRELQQE